MVLDEEQIARIGANVRRLHKFSSVLKQNSTLSKDDLLRAMDIMDELHAVLLGDRYQSEKMKKSD
ncbi:hypothetical protein [Aeromonas bivalvium]|uniref:hypothetical protein n=1 Tax=Aeromonas bivalvium TaxID=440079 RepID=UPI0038D24485